MNTEPKKISVKEFAKKLDLEIVFEGKGELSLSTVNVSRPGLQLAGFFDYFGENRVHVLGNAEMKYYNAKQSCQKTAVIDAILKRKVPCTIISRNLDVPEELYQNFIKHETPLFRSKLETTQLVNNLIIFLNDFLAPTTMVHGVFIDVSGVGVLLTGKSGVGKSETALELIKRGHRFVADDAVLIKNVQNKLFGTAPEVIRHFMELRGIGIIDTRSLYGVTAVKESKRVDLVIEMVNFDEKKEYDRLDGESAKETILGVELPKVVLPVTAGRDMPIVIEAAAANFLLKKSGISSAKILLERTDLGK